MVFAAIIAFWNMSLFFFSPICMEACQCFAAAWEPSEARVLFVSVRRRSETFLGAFFSLLYRRAHTWHVIVCKNVHMCLMHGARCEEI